MSTNTKQLELEQTIKTLDAILAGATGPLTAEERSKVYEARLVAGELLGRLLRQ